MKITPLELKKPDFKKGVWGFKVDEVDSLLATAAETLEEMVKENIELKTQCAELKEKLENFLGMESTLNETLIMAQKASEAARQSAEREAELIIAKAEVQAEKLLDEARAKQKELKNQIERLEYEKAAFLVRMRSMVASQWKMLQEEKFEEESFEVKQEETAVEEQTEQAPGFLEEEPPESEEDTGVEESEYPASGGPQAAADGEEVAEEETAVEDTTAEEETGEEEVMVEEEASEEEKATEIVEEQEEVQQAEAAKVEDDLSDTGDLSSQLAEILKSEPSQGIGGTEDADTGGEDQEGSGMFLDTEKSESDESGADIQDLLWDEEEKEDKEEEEK